MKKFFLGTLFVLPLLSVGCVSVPHKAGSNLMKTEDGKTQVKVQLHKDDPTEIGSSVGAYEQKCRKVIRKDFDAERCSFYLVGTGKIISILEDAAMVEFPANVRISSSTTFESDSKM